jgi:hypothetical protein
MKTSGEQHRSVPSAVALLIAIATFATGGGFASQALAQSKGNSGLPFAPGNPLADLQRQVNELQESLFPRLYQAKVDCYAGNKVTDALRQAPKGAGRVILTIEGTCVEDVTISRDNVTLQVAYPNSGLRGSPTSSALTLNGGRRIELKGLTLTSGFNGLRATAGASFSASDLLVTDAVNAGILVEQNATGVLNNVTVKNGSWSGIRTGTGGVVSVFGGRIEYNRDFGVFNEGGQVSLAGGVVIAHNYIGAHAVNGGTLMLEDAIVTMSGGVGVNLDTGFAIIRGENTLVTKSTRTAVNVSAGGAVWLSDKAQVAGNFSDGIFANGSSLHITREAVVSNNAGTGVSIGNASSALITEASEIRDNGRDGINISDTSAASFYPQGALAPKVTGNTGFGIYCQGAPAVAQYWGDPMINGNTNSLQTNCPGH